MDEDHKKSEVVDNFIANVTSVTHMLDRLQKAAGDHFGKSPEEVNWGDVGSLANVAEKLKQASDFIFGGGEEDLTVMQQDYAQQQLLH